MVHHLTAAGKRRLFADLAGRLSRGGALLLADLVKPPSARVADLWARQWDEAVRGQCLAQTGSLQAFAVFERERWNFYRDATPDPYDRPSGLVEQLSWIEVAGFKTADCFWMHAGHAIYGGYR